MSPEPSFRAFLLRCLAGVLALAWAAGIAAAAPTPLLIRLLATGSMRPAVSHTMILPLDPVAYAQLRIGDVAVYRHDRTGLVVAHRIVARQFHWFVMKGDSNRRDDTGFMTRRNYLGLVHLPVAAAHGLRTGRFAEHRVAAQTPGHPR